MIRKDIFYQNDLDYLAFDDDGLINTYELTILTRNCCVRVY